MDGVIAIGAAYNKSKNYTDKYLTTGVIPKGTWNASTNTPTITQGTGIIGWYYEVVVEGDWDSKHFYVGDKVLFTANNKWERIPNSYGEIIEQLVNQTLLINTTGDTGTISDDDYDILNVYNHAMLKNDSSLYKKHYETTDDIVYVSVEDGAYDAKIQFIKVNKSTKVFTKRYKEAISELNEKKDTISAGDSTATITLDSGSKFIGAYCLDTSKNKIDSNVVVDGLNITFTISPQPTEDIECIVVYGR